VGHRVQYTELVSYLLVSPSDPYDVGIFMEELNTGSLYPCLVNATSYQIKIRKVEQCFEGGLYTLKEASL
jgi:hypothetical protein